MPNMLVKRIHTRNNTEWELTQKLAFKLGYRWLHNSSDINSPVTASYQYLSIWDDKQLRMGDGENLDITEFTGNISFEEFLDYVEQQILTR